MVRPNLVPKILQKTQNLKWGSSPPKSNAKWFGVLAFRCQKFYKTIVVMVLNAANLAQKI
jgi:hypothetical protein